MAAATSFKHVCSKLMAHPWWVGVSGLAAVVSAFYAMPATELAERPADNLPMPQVLSRSPDDFSRADGDWIIWETVSEKLGGYWIKWVFTVETKDNLLVLQGRKLSVNDEPADDRERKAVFAADLAYDPQIDIFTGRAEERNASGEVLRFDVELRIDEACSTLAAVTYQGGEFISKWTGSRQGGRRDRASKAHNSAKGDRGRERILFNGSAGK